MLLPIGDEQVQGGAKPIFSYGLIFINILVFLYEFGMPPELSEHFIYHFGAIPEEIIHGQDMYTLFSCMFLHGGWLHLIGNMLFLWVFADNIEAILGTFKFILFYIAGGVIASVTHVFFEPGSMVPMVGASGAISAVMGAYMVMFPSSKIRVFVLIFFSSIYIPAIFFLGIWMLQQMFSGIGSINQTGEQSSEVAWFAHIGGFVFGVLIGFLAKQKFGKRYQYVE